MMTTLSHKPGAQDFSGTSLRSRGFVRSRIQNFGLTMIVMGASFILYYLGLFGGVPGPLQPARIGDRLAAWGFSDRHLLALMVLLMVIAITWNWIYNILNRLLGRQRICTHQNQEIGGICAAPIVKRTKNGAGSMYRCSAGHQCPNVRIRTLKKGTVGHFIWMMWLAFAGIVFYHIL